MRALFVLAVLLLAGCSGPPRDGSGQTIEPAPPEVRDNVSLELVADGFDRPLLVTHAGDDRLWVLGQTGEVHVLDGDERRRALDIGNRISTGGERGLLGLAFDPADRSRAFVSYTGDGGASVLSRFSVEGDALVDQVRLLETMQPASNHNGGHVAFGPDGWLYYALGDGGGADDTYQNGQNKMTILGTVLRLDVSGPSVRAAPGNPFEDDPTGDDRIWAYGLRNPWRFSFDDDGNLWIADVGQNAWEEVNRQSAGSRGGQNYGWPAYEGTHRNRGLDAPGHVPPIAEYERNRPQCSITGGYVGQDPGVPELMDRYVFGDYCSGRIWTLHEEGGDWIIQELMDTDMLISSFGEDAQGRLYVVDLNGAVHRFV